MQHIGGSTLPDKWHILVCQMEAALVVRAHLEHSSSLITESVCVAANVVVWVLYYWWW